MPINSVTLLFKMWSGEACIKNDSSRLQEENFPVQAEVKFQISKSPEENQNQHFSLPSSETGSFKTYHMHSEEILSIQHWQKIGPCSVFTTFCIIKEDANTLMIFL